MTPVLERTFGKTAWPPGLVQREPLSHRERGRGEGPDADASAVQARTLTRPTGMSCERSSESRNHFAAHAGGAPSPDGRGEQPWPSGAVFLARAGDEST